MECNIWAVTIPVVKNVAVAAMDLDQSTSARCTLQDLIMDLTLVTVFQSRLTCDCESVRIDAKLVAGPSYPEVHPFAIYNIFSQVHVARRLSGAKHEPWIPAQRETLKSPDARDWVGNVG